MQTSLVERVCSRHFFGAKILLQEQLAFGASFEDTTVKLPSKLHIPHAPLSEHIHYPTYIETLSLEVSPFS